MPHRRMKAKLAIPRSKTFPPMRHPDKPSSSSGQGVDQHGFSSVPSFTTAYSPNSTLGEVLCQQPYGSNYECNSFTNHNQVNVFAGDTILHTVVEIESEAATSLERPIAHDILRGVGSGDTTEEHQNQHQTSENRGVVSGDTTEEHQNQHQTSENRGVVSGDTTGEHQNEHQTSKNKGVVSGDTTVEHQNQHQTSERQTRCLSLYRAALKGDWQEAKVILEADQDAIQDSITEAHETVLHIACATKHTAFVKELVRFLTVQDLERTNKNGYTALCFAAQLGIVTIAKEMVGRDNGLPLIRSIEGKTPLYIAASLGRRDMVSYLFSVTPFAELEPCERMEIFIATISHDMYDIALKILENDDNSEAANDMIKIAAFRELAKKPSAIGSTSQLSHRKGYSNSLLMQSAAHKLAERLFPETQLFSALMQSAAHELVERLLRNTQLFSDFVDRHISDSVDSLLFDAAKFGNVEFLVLIIRSYPHIIWKTDNRQRSLFHIAVSNRQESVFNLIYEIVAIKEIILTYVDSEKGDNILHLAGELADESRLNILSGAALQMQRELLWFKEVEKIVPPSYRNMKNHEDLTPWDSFKKKHKALKIEGEKWMKDTANFCMIVSTLITTVVFAAAFTVPGGNKDTGTPILLKHIWFRVFFISDSIAMLSSSTSILIFLSILTCRFTELDFLLSLPLKLVFGLTALFISIVGMVLAFVTTCFMVVNTEQVFLPTVLLCSASVPMFLFLRLHFKLWFDVICSTHASRFLFSPLQTPLVEDQ